MPRTINPTLSFLIFRFSFFIFLLLLLIGCQSTSVEETSIAETAVSNPPTQSVSTPTAQPTPTKEASPTTPDTPTPNPSPTIQSQSPNQPTNQPTNTPTPNPALTINNIPYQQLIPMDEQTRQNVRETYLLGQELGRHPRRFSKVGDSVIAHAQFLTIFETHDYNLAQYNHLQPVLEHFDGSYVRYGVAIKVALRAWSVFDPLWANKEWCEPNENMLDCEIRLNNPAYLVVRLGSNDVGSPSVFDKHMRDIVEQCLEQGIIPILGTKADRFEGDNSNNEIIRKIGTDYHIPIWEFDILAATLPNRGIIEDDPVHLTQWIEQDYTLPIAYKTGHAMQNLSFLFAMNEVWQTAEDR